ncbi:MAG: hypothetical protein L6R19_26855 [Alphaproteobacteria bacterium]|nr:hypothetical protein [Alphaproteobacteria bacterium]
MASENELTLRRVVVALDVAADFAPAIELAATVAAGWRAGLRGLFAEDERLHRLAALPFAQQLEPATALRSPISAEGMRAEIDALMRRMRQELESVAERHGLQWSFDAAPGSIDRDELVIESDELLAIGLSTRPIMSQMRLGSPWQRTVGRLRRRVLLVRGRSDANAALAVLYDATPPSRRALDAAIRIAGACRRPLILVTPEQVPDAQRVEAEAAAQAAGVRTRSVVARSASLAALPSALPVRVDLLIVGGDGVSAIDASERMSSGAVLIV